MRRSLPSLPVPSEPFDLVRLFFLPWMYNAVDQSENSSKAAFEAGDHWKFHFILLYFDLSGETNVPRWRVYDSRPIHIRRVLQDFRTYVQRVVTGLQWFTYPTTLQNANQEMLPFQAEEPIIVPQQTVGWTCGVHTIINAWILAIGLDINKTFKPTGTSYADAIRVINLVSAGYADGDLVFNFLCGSGWAITPASRPVESNFGELLGEHNIRDHASLTRYINGIQGIEDTAFERLTSRRTRDLGCQVPANSNALEGLIRRILPPAAAAVATPATAPTTAPAAAPSTTPVAIDEDPKNGDEIRPKPDKKPKRKKMTQAQAKVKAKERAETQKKARAEKKAEVQKNAAAGPAPKTTEPTPSTDLTSERRETRAQTKARLARETAK